MSDIIRRADAMGAVQDNFSADGFRGYDDGQKMMDRIKELPSADRELANLKEGFESADADWIPCSERMPLVSGEFLVTLFDNDGTWVSTAQWNMTFGGRWQDIFPNDGYRDISNVIAWKTLPKPYKGGDTE